MSQETQNESASSDKMIHVHLPGEMNKMFNDLKDVRSKNFEPTSYTSIVMDALKAYHTLRVAK